MVVGDEVASFQTQDQQPASEPVSQPDGTAEGINHELPLHGKDNLIGSHALFITSV